MYKAFIMAVSAFHSVIVQGRSQDLREVQKLSAEGTRISGVTNVGVTRRDKLMVSPYCFLF